MGHIGQQLKENMSDKFIIGNDDQRYKIILVGDVSVGKTALFYRFTEGEFLASKDNMVTTIDFKMKLVNINNKAIKLYLWDTAGSEKYRSIVSTYFKGCQGVIIVFDLSRQDSFRNATDEWYMIAKTKTPTSKFILVGNKCDLDIRVPRQQIEAWCDKSQVPYIEVSVKENKNVNLVFESLAATIHRSLEGKQVIADKGRSSKRLSLQAEGRGKKKCC